VTQLQYSRREIVATLRRAGFAEAADEALRVLPDPVDTDQIQAFCQQHNLTLDDLISQMGGSP
jgi:antitoxin component HigA of HigAB toxin-antitoxin module